MEGGGGPFCFQWMKGKKEILYISDTYSCDLPQCEKLTIFSGQVLSNYLIWKYMSFFVCLCCIYCQLWHTGLQGYCFLHSHSLPFQVLSKMSFYFWFWFPICDILIVVLCFNKCFTYFRQFMLLFCSFTIIQTLF